MRIAVVAPISPAQLVEHLDPVDAARAAEIPGNYGQASTALVAALVRSGHYVLAVSHRRGQQALEFSGPRLRVVQVESRISAGSQAKDWWRAERRAMVEVLSKADVEVVHGHWTYEWALAALCSAHPCVITARDAPFTILMNNRDLYRLFRTALAGYVRVRGRDSIFLAASPYMAKKWNTQMFWRRNVPIIPNLVAPDVHKSGRQKTSHPSFVEIADGGRRKNVRQLLRAFQLVRKKHANATLEIIGDGLSADDHIGLWAAERGLDAGVHFRGACERSDVLSALERSWVHVHASLEESFGNTIIEAMAMGTAVVAGAKSGAVPWVLGEGECGLLVDVRTPEALATGMAQLIEDESWRTHYVQKSEQYFHDNYSSEQVVRLHLCEYGKAIEGVVR